MKKLISPANSIAFSLIAFLCYASISIAAPFEPPTINGPTNPSTQVFQQSKPPVLQQPKLQRVQVLPPDRIISNLKLNIQSPQPAPDVWMGVFCSPFTFPDTCNNENGVVTAAVASYSIPQKNYTKGRLVFGGSTVDFDCRNVPQGSMCNGGFLKPVVLAQGNEGLNTCNTFKGAPLRTVLFSKALPWKLTISDKEGKSHFDEGTSDILVKMRCIQ